MKEFNPVIKIYLVLIVTGAFSDATMLSLTTLPIFFIFIIFFLMALFNLPVHPQRREWLSSTLLVIGVSLLLPTIYYTAIETTEYLTKMSRSDDIEQFSIITLLKESKLYLSFASALFLTWGIQERTRWPIKTLIFIGIDFLLAAPLTAIIVKILGISSAN